MSEQGVWFVAGATGYTGRAVVQRLVQQGLPCVAHVRPDSAQLQRWRDDFGGLGVQVDSTPWDADAMQARFLELRPRGVFALLGTTRKRARAAGLSAAQHYQEVDYGLSKLLIDAAEGLGDGAGARFIYLSSMGVSEGTRSAYLSARARCEAALEQSSLDYVVARPSFITGPTREERRLGERYAASVADACLTALAWVGWRKPKQSFGSIDAEGLARALTAAALDPALSRCVLHSAQLQELARMP